MKKLSVFITCFILLQNICDGQIPYHPFPVSNAQWAEVEGSYNTGDFYYTGKLYILSSDTVINGKTYTLVGYNNTWYATGPINSDIYNYSYQLPGAIFGAIREDSSRKVWIRLLDSSAIGIFDQYFPPPPISHLDTDIILYDFSLKKGDTIRWMPVWGGLNYNIVTGVDSFRLSSGEWRNQIDINGFFDEWIEGIGSIRGLLGPYKGPNPEGGSYNLICFTTDTTTYSFPSNNVYLGINCTWVYNGINKIDNPSFSFHPNPASDKIYINSLQNISEYNIEIIDVLGRRVIKQAIQNNSIDISSVCDGFYIIRLENKNGDILYSNKFVKD